MRKRFVLCKNPKCAAEGPERVTATRAIEAWNAWRAPSDTATRAALIAESHRRIHAMSHSWGDPAHIAAQPGDDMTVARVRRLVGELHAARREAMEEAAKVAENEWRILRPKGKYACSWGLRRRWGVEVATRIRTLSPSQPEDKP